MDDEDSRAVAAVLAAELGRAVPDVSLLASAIVRALDSDREQRGLVLSPKEPTADMLAAGARIDSWTDPRDIYRAMIRARPR